MSNPVQKRAPEREQARKVSIVIPTHNNLSLLLECIESLRSQDYPRESIEVVVVDNGSTDRTPHVLGERFPHVKLLRMETNTGFAVACNAGASVAGGDFVAFLNNDAVADSGWLSSLFRALDVGGEATVCAASRIVSRDGTETEFSGAASNLFGAGRPTSVWGWPDNPEPPATGSPILFASGGAMLIHRDTFLEVGGFDPSYFAYFEDVDLGWRLWLLGYRIVYAPDAVVKHIGGATGRRSGLHRQYTLWECNALATVIKNYESGNMEKLLSAALLLQYKRALLSTGDAIPTEDYRLGGPRDTNTANVERLPKVSVAHIAAIDRLNSILPQLMEKRRDIQARRVRSDAEILPLLGRPFEAQYAGAHYAEVVRELAAALDLYDITAQASPNRVLIVGGNEEAPGIVELAARLKSQFLVATAIVDSEASGSAEVVGGYTTHRLRVEDDNLANLLAHADVVVVMPSRRQLAALRETTAPVAFYGGPSDEFDAALLFYSSDDPRLIALCREPRARSSISL
jgi:GT2 family glycosyltransferase